MVPQYLQQVVANCNDGDIAGSQMLSRPVLNGSHAFLHCGVLHAYTRDTRKGLTATLKLTVDQVFVSPVQDGPIAPGLILGMNPTPAPAGFKFLFSKGAVRMPFEAVSQAVFIVDGHPGVPTDRGTGLDLRDQLVKRHQPVLDVPLGEIPLVVPMGDHESVIGRSHLSFGKHVGIKSSLRSAKMEKRDVDGVDATLHRLQPVAFLPAP